MAKSSSFLNRQLRAKFAKISKRLTDIIKFCARGWTFMINWLKSRFRRIVTALSLTAVLLVINFIWLHVAYNLTNEDTLIRWESIIKRTTFLDSYTNNIALKDSLLLVDFSAAKRLVKKTGIAGDVVETDLNKLHTLLGAINSQGNIHRYIICDLLFDQEEEELITEIQKTKRIVLPYVLTEDGKQEGISAHGVKTGYVGFPISSGPFSSPLLLKYELFAQGNKKTLPVVMYEELHHTVLSPQNKMFVKSDQGLLSNSGILDLRVRPFHFENPTNSTQLLAIDELLGIISLDDKEAFSQLFKKKYVLIGDFKNDLHPTVFGDVPGTLILMNMYYSLTKQDNRIAPDWIIFEAICLFLTCYLLINVKGSYGKGWLSKLMQSPYGDLLSLTLITTLLFWAISISSYLIFDKHLDVIAMVLLLGIGSSVYTIFKLLKKPCIRFYNYCKNLLHKLSL